MPNPDPLSSQKVKRSFCIKAKSKPHKRIHPCLRQLRINFNGIDISRIDLTQLPPIERRPKSKLRKFPEGGGDNLGEIREDVECLTLEADDHEAIKAIRMGAPICDSDEAVELDVMMPNGMTVTLSVPGNKTLHALKPEAILQAKRYRKYN